MRLKSSPRASHPTRWLALAVLAACAPEGGVAGEADAAMPDAGAYAPALQQQPAQASAQLDESRATAIVKAASRVAPAVVSVNVISTQPVQARSMWESFFLPPGAARRAVSFGSGVIVRPEGLIVTNNHVIEGADQIRVTLSTGADVEAELVGTDPLADIAVLRVQGRDLPAAPVGSAQGLMIGEWALAIGNPLGNYVGDTQPTVTAGVVSAVGRNIAPSSGDQGFYLGMIQTDAAINPGNSGGPLVNAAGEVIGINASIISRSGGSEGLGFAIPIDRALRIVDDLLRFGEIRRAWVGIEVEAVEADAWGRTRGVRIASVAPGSPGDRASLRAGDHLLTANRKPLAGPLDFQGALLDLRAGDRLSLEVEGRRGAVDIEAVAFPSTTAARVRVLEGIDLITVTPEIRAERGLTSEAGALIAGISNELAQQLGLQPGDVIIGINRTPIRSAEDFAGILQRVSGPFSLTFERRGGYNVRTFYR
jgi:S1-C subfamily serine protease